MRALTPVFRRLARALEGARLGLLLDLGHLHVMSQNAAADIAALPLPVHEVHVSDNSGKTDEHMPLGKGNLPIDEIAVELCKAGFEGIWTLEMRPHYYMHLCCITNKTACRAVRSSRRRLEEALERAGRGTTGTPST